MRKFKESFFNFYFKFLLKVKIFSHFQKLFKGGPLPKMQKSGDLRELKFSRGIAY